MKPDKTIDITKQVCPMTFVYTKLAIEKMEAGQILEIILNDGEPLTNVPRSLTEEGHKVHSVETHGSNYRILVQKC